MKRLLLSIIWGTILMVISLHLFAQVGINTDGSDPDPSAGLDVKFNNKGLLPPRMSYVELNAISNPANGLIVYCIDCGANGLGALSMYMAGSWYNLTADCMNPLAPVSGIHVATSTEIVWNWNPILNALGYKWGPENNYNTAIDMGINTSKIETGLTCNTPYVRYIWAYNGCSKSAVTILTKSTTPAPPDTPTSGTHISSLSQIIWKWNTIDGATGYKWSILDDYASALDMGSDNTKTETGLTCNTLYTRYIWAYNGCDNSSASTTSQSTSQNISSPVPGIHIPSTTQVLWKWNPVPGAIGYKWNTTPDFNFATEIGIDRIAVKHQGNTVNR